MGVSVPLAFGWRHLLFANWPASADRLATHLPGVLAVDEYEGDGWVSVVAFVDVETRPRGLPAWTGLRLPEVNVRTYVTHDGDPGIYFLSLDAQSLLGVLGARLTHYLPYYYARGHFRWTDGRVDVASRRRQPGDRPAVFEASYRPTGEPFVADPDSLAAFLTERRRLYTQAPDGTLHYTDVRHERWTLHPAEVAVEENSLFEANGLPAPDSEPELYYSPGVDAVATRSRGVERTEDHRPVRGEQS